MFGTEWLAKIKELLQGVQSAIGPAESDPMRAVSPSFTALSTAPNVLSSPTGLYVQVIPIMPSLMISALL